MKNPGGGYKVNLLRKAIKPFKDDKEKIILFTDRLVSNRFFFLNKIEKNFEHLFQLRCNFPKSSQRNSEKIRSNRSPNFIWC